MDTAPAKSYNDAMDEFVKNDYVALVVNSFREHVDRIHYVMSVVKRLSPETILDLGSSWGLFGALVRWQRGYCPKRIVAVDFSEKALDSARRFGKYDETCCIDASQPFDLQRRFDLVLCTEILEHVPDPVVVARNAVKHSCGHVLFSTPVEMSIDGHYHVRHVSMSDLQQYVATAGGSIVDSYFLESVFNEKPHWLGWNFVLATGGVKCAI